MIYERVAAMLPYFFRKWFSAQLVYAGIKVHPERFVGFIVTMGVLASAVISAVSYLLMKTDPLAVFPLAVFVIIGGALFLINNKAEKEGKLTEKILPDALQLIASNIKAGLTTERAFLASAQPEFGSFSEELKEVGSRILSGERMDRSLLLIPTRIKSDVLDRAIWLIAQGIRSGGQIANLLLQLSSDLREENALKAEVSASISMYIMLIFFSAAFGAPMLLGISSYIVGVLSEQTSNIGLSPEQMADFAAQSPALSLLGISASPISEEFIVMFAEISLFFTCIFASLVLGAISTGHEKDGIKYIPVLLIITFVLFFVTRYVVQTFLGGMMF